MSKVGFGLRYITDELRDRHVLVFCFTNHNGRKDRLKIFPDICKKIKKEK